MTDVSGRSVPDGLSSLRDEASVSAESSPKASILSAEMRSLADRLEATYEGWNPGDEHTGAGDAFATMCLMSDALNALGEKGGLAECRLSPRELVAALRTGASK
jgi:hypothetical protein